MDLLGKKRIFLISRSFYPENSPRSFRTTELVKGFARMGHEVTLLTVKSNSHHIPFENEYGITIKNIGPLRFPNINLDSRASLLKRIMVRGLQHFFEYPDIELMFRLKKALKTENDYDLMISIAVPHTIHWGVAWARSKNHPIADVWAADCGDPYMGFDIDRIRKPFYFKYLEKMFCRNADYITVPVEEAKEAYYSEFRQKIEVIPQGFNFDEVSVDKTEVPADDLPIFGYAGNLLGGGRNPHELLEFLVNLNRDYRFVIYTQNERPAKPYLDKARGRIEVRNYIPRPKLLKELSEMHFLVNLENDTSSQVPSKLIDYYLAGRPVLSVPSSGLNTETVNRFLDGDYRDQYVFNDMDQYRISNVCRQFLDLCKTKEYQ